MMPVMAFCFWLVPVTKVQMTLFNRRSGCFFLYKTFELVLPSSPPPPLLSIGNSSSSPVSSINWRTKLSRTYSHQIIHSECIITFQMYLILKFTFGRLKSDGTLCRRVICGRSGNFSKSLKRRGKVFLISALCSRAFICFSFLMSSSNSKLSRMTATNKLSTI